MKKEIFVFLVDDMLNIVYNSKVINKKMKDVIGKGRIVDRLKFMEEFIKVVKQEKVKTSLFGGNIILVKNVYFNEMETFFLDNIFIEMGFNKVIYLDIRELLPNMNATFIEINNTYMVISGEEIELFLDLDYFKDIPGILDYLDIYLKGDIVLFGLNKIIPKIKLNDKDVYYLDDFANYICECLLKVKKYGA